MSCVFLLQLPHALLSLKAHQYRWTRGGCWSHHAEPDLLCAHTALCWHLCNRTRSVLQRISCSPFPAVALLTTCEDLCTSSNVFYLVCGFLCELLEAGELLPSLPFPSPFPTGVGADAPHCPGWQVLAALHSLHTCCHQKAGSFYSFQTDSAVLILLYLVNVTAKYVLIITTCKRYK